jgi:transposase
MRGVGVVAAPLPERIIDKSLVSDQIVIDTMVRKYCDSMPLYRQSANRTVCAPHGNRGKPPCLPLSKRSHALTLY